MLALGVGAALPPDDTPRWLVSVDEALGGMFMPDEDVLWRPSAGYSEEADDKHPLWGQDPMVIDARGFRTTRRPGDAAPPPADHRAIVLGGSHPFGMYVDNHQAYPAVLERSLQQRGRWEVINAACPGHTTFQGLRYLERLLPLRPDVVIFDLGINDALPLAVDWAVPDHEVAQAPSTLRALSRELAVSPLYRLLSRLLAPTQRPPPGAVRVPRERSLANADAALALGHQHGFDVLLVSQFSLRPPPDPGVECALDWAPRTPIADACGLFAQDGAQVWESFVDPIHANAAGHARIAALIEQTLDEAGWLDR